MRTRSIALAAMLLSALPAASQLSEQLSDIDWQLQHRVPAGIPEQIITDHIALRAFTPHGELVETKERGLMKVERRGGAYPDGQSGVNIPASITVSYRNRLIAAALGYRLGSALTENGVVIESWSGASDCSFTRWRLEFAGERLELTETGRFRSPRCRN